jgi:hypothetical protein
MGGAMVFFFIIIIIILVRFIAGGLDDDRIKTFIENQGGKMISKSWDPFGKGWFGDKSNRIYKVIYLDKDGNKHESYVKTSAFSGVYFTEDKVIEFANNENSSHP